MVVNFNQLWRGVRRKAGPGSGPGFIAYSVRAALRIEALLKALLAYWEVTGRENDGFASLDSGAVLAKALLNLQTAIERVAPSVTSDPLPNRGSRGG